MLTPTLPAAANRRFASAMVCSAAVTRVCRSLFASCSLPTSRWDASALLDAVPLSCCALVTATFSASTSLFLSRSASSSVLAVLCAFCASAAVASSFPRRSAMARSAASMRFRAPPSSVWRLATTERAWLSVFAVRSPASLSAFRMATSADVRAVTASSSCRCSVLFCFCRRSSCMDVAWVGRAAPATCDTGSLMHSSRGGGRTCFTSPTSSCATLTAISMFFSFSSFVVSWPCSLSRSCVTSRSCRRPPGQAQQGGSQAESAYTTHPPWLERRLVQSAAS